MNEMHNALLSRPLTYFRVLARHGSLSRAAEEIGIGQSALSRSMTQFEAALGVRLLERDTHGVALTPAGHAMAERADLLAAAAHVSHRVVRLKDRKRPRTLRFGATPSLNQAVLPDCLAALWQAGTEVHASTVEGPPARLLPAIDRGEIDIYLGPLPARAGRNPEVVYEYCADVPSVVLVAQDHALAQRSEVAHEDLLDAPWIALTGFGDGSGTESWNAVLTELARKLSVPEPTILFEAGSVEVAIAMASRTSALLCLSKLMEPVARRSGLVALPLAEPLTRNATGIAYLAPVGADPEVGTLIEDLSQAIRRHRAPNRPAASLGARRP